MMPGTNEMKCISLQRNKIASQRSFLERILFLIFQPYRHQVLRAAICCADRAINPVLFDSQERYMEHFLLYLFLQEQSGIPVNFAFIFGSVVFCLK